MFRLLKVTGHSLEPLFEEGDFVLVCKIPFLYGRLRPGDVVALRHPEHGTLIKLVEDVEPGRVSVIGLQAGSVDSRSFGPVPLANLIGKVIWHIRMPRPDITKL